MSSIEHCRRINDVLALRGIPYPPCGFDIGPGWLPIVEQALDEMIAAGWDRQLDQTKQKFCTLRLYLRPQVGRDAASHEAIEAAVDRAVAECDYTCEDCGRPHGLEVPRSGVALCPDCAKEPK